MTLFRAVLVGDSRLVGFDRYVRPTNLNLDFVIKRGACVEDLVEPTVQLLQQKEFRNADIVVVKLVAGINNFTSIISHSEGKELTLSHTSELGVFQKIVAFKERVKKVCPQALVGFATIPTLSFQKNIQHRIEVGKLRKSKYSSGEILRFQQELDEKLVQINARIKFDNSRKQTGHSKGCLTVSLHRDITRESKRRNRGGKLRVVTRNTFNQLYDGLHAKSELKLKWFERLCKALKSEISFTLKDRAASVRVTIEEEVTEEQTSRSNSWDFKRNK